MKVELTDQEIISLGTDRSLNERRYWGTFAITLALVVLFVLLTEGRLNAWVQIGGAAPILIVGFGLSFNMTRKAVKEGRNFLAELKQQEEGERG